MAAIATAAASRGTLAGSQEKGPPRRTAPSCTAWLKTRSCRDRFLRLRRLRVFRHFRSHNRSSARPHALHQTLSAKSRAANQRRFKTQLPSAFGFRSLSGSSTLRSGRTRCVALMATRCGEGKPAMWARPKTACPQRTSTGSPTFIGDMAMPLFGTFSARGEPESTSPLVGMKLPGSPTTGGQTPLPPFLPSPARVLAEKAQRASVTLQPGSRNAAALQPLTARRPVNAGP